MGALGINIVDFFIYIALFFILYLIINWKLVKPLDAILTKRETEVKQNAENKEKLENALGNFEEEKEKIKAELRASFKAEAEKILASAKDEASTIVGKSRKDADEILVKAQSTIAIERENYKEELNKKFEETLKKTVLEVYQTNKVEIDKVLIERAINDLNS